MATKADMIERIKSYDPNHPILAGEPTHKALTEELKRLTANERAKPTESSKTMEELETPKRSSVPDPISVTMFWRKEHTGYSFVLMGGDDVQNTRLEFSHELHQPGALITVSNTLYRIVETRESLKVTAGDLERREEIDPRRIYETPSGSRIVYKRQGTDGKIIVWSFKASGEIVLGSQVELKPTADHAPASAAPRKRLTQKVLAAYLIAQRPTITATELSEALAKSFPDKNVGPRHGPHYLSLSRGGRLPEAPNEDPRLWTDKEE